MKHKQPSLRQCNRDAINWYVRMQDTELPQKEVLDWERWMASSEDNRRDFAEVEGIWRKLDALDEIPLPDKSELLADNYAGQASVKKWLLDNPQNGQTANNLSESNLHKSGRQDKHSPPSYSRRLISQFALAASIVGLVIGAGLWNLKQPPTQGNFQADQVHIYETLEGEHRDIPLNDGSTITLGAKSSFSTSFTAQRRTIILNEGEAYFQVAHDPSRPFVVLAGSRSITAIGTAFNIRRYDQRVVVAVTEGKIKLSQQDANTLSTKAPHKKHSADNLLQEMTDQTTLVKGEQINYDPNGKLSEVTPAIVDDITAWQTGHLEYRGEPLKFVVTDVNRYSPRKIFIIDNSISNLTYTGTVFYNQIDEWIKGLTDVFPVKVVELNDKEVLITSQVYQAESIQ